MAKVIVIGAGITGLSVGYFLGSDYEIFEKEDSPGGLCRSVKARGYTFDYSGHFLHLHNENTKRFILKLLSGNIKEINRKTWIYIHGNYVPFPFQANLYYLPEKIRKECLESFIARRETESRSFYGWSVSTFGKGITRYFMRPYNEKLWTVSSKTLTSDWVAPFVPVPTLEEIKNGATAPQNKKFGYNASFYYPVKGGIGALIDSLHKTAGNVRLGLSCDRIDYKNRIIETSDGRKTHYEFLVSTQPLFKLIESIKDVPGKVKDASKELRWNCVFCLNLGIVFDKNQTSLAEGRHWIYFPEKKYPFYRVGFYKNIMPSSCPPGRSSMYIESSFSPHEKTNEKALLKKSLNALKEIGILKNGNKIELVNSLKMPVAYVIYDSNREKALGTIQRFLISKGIYSIGRYGGWEYSFMEKNILDAKKLAEELRTKN